MNLIKRGEIYLADLRHDVKDEEEEMRFVLIVQNEIANRYSPTVSVISISPNLGKEHLPTHIKISKEELALSENAVALAEQIRTIDNRRLIKKVGQIKDENLKKLDKALKVQFSLSH